MLLDKLLDHFDRYTNLPIDVNDVRDQLIELGVQDRILFHFVKMDSLAIRGLLYRHVERLTVYGDPQFCSDILIADEMDEEKEAWQRLVAVKELLHITDCDSLSAESEEAVTNLFHKFSFPPEVRRMSPAVKGVKSFLNDEVRIYAALAILIPAGCREVLRPLYAEGKWNSREIAAFAKVPERYVEVVLSDSFDEFIASICDWENSENGN